MSKSIPKALRIPPPLYQKISEIVEETGLNEHATMLQLIEEGIKARRMGGTEQKIRHMASQLDSLVDGLGGGKKGRKK